MALFRWAANSWETIVVIAKKKKKKLCSFVGVLISCCAFVNLPFPSIVEPRLNGDHELSQQNVDLAMKQTFFFSSQEPSITISSCFLINLFHLFLSFSILRNPKWTGILEVCCPRRMSPWIKTKIAAGPLS